VQIEPTLLRVMHILMRGKSHVDSFPILGGVTRDNWNVFKVGLIHAITGMQVDGQAYIFSNEATMKDACVLRASAAALW
jgi:hypothetical protein